MIDLATVAFLATFNLYLKIKKQIQWIAVSVYAMIVIFTWYNIIDGIHTHVHVHVHRLIGLVRLDSRWLLRFVPPKLSQTLEVPMSCNLPQDLKSFVAIQKITHFLAAVRS